MKKLSFLIVSMASMFTLLSPQAFAYSGSSAAQYADQWWNSYNSNYPNYNSIFTGGDCTNFVSQAVHAGGYSFVGDGGTTTDDHNWYMDGPYYTSLDDPGTWYHSNSWSVVSDFRQFLFLDYQGGSDEGTTTDMSTPYAPGSGTQGDAVFYDWDSNGTWDHASILVGTGTDPNSMDSGSLVDEHSNSRYHAIWTLAPYNSSALTTTIDTVHISSQNN